MIILLLHIHYFPYSTPFVLLAKKILPNLCHSLLALFLSFSKPVNNAEGEEQQLVG